MKKYLLIALVFFIALFALYSVVRAKVRSDLSQPVQYPHVTIAPTQQLKQVRGVSDENIKKSLFVPYWSIADGSQLDSSYDEYIYFGVSPDKRGLNQDDAGMANLQTFINIVPQDKEKFLTLRMIEPDITTTILDSKTAQKQVITDTVALAKEQGFSGVVLDLELSAIPFDSLVKQISDFTAVFYRQTKQKNLRFTITLYGDSFYRPRPFDLKALSKNADSFLIMAYDFHKAKANPGPNFPLHGSDIYGYDMAQMTNDFLSVESAKNTAVIFGYFGYDWQVNDKGSGLGQATPLTYAQIQQRFLESCNFSDCTIKRDNTSAETSVHYTDEDGQKHIVWFEDPQSVQKKQEYLQGKGISAFSFWANGYF